MKGIILAGDSGNRLYPLTLGIPKQLLPVYDKPMIYYPIEVLVEAGITDILIITSPQYANNFKMTLGDGASLGAHFTYMSQAVPDGAAKAFTIGKEFVGNEAVCMITGDCIIMGDDRANKLRKAIRAAKNSGQATIFVIRDDDPKQYGVAKLDEKGKVTTVEGQLDDYNKFAITGLYVFPKGVSNYAQLVEKSERGRFEITSLNNMYLEKNKLQVQRLGDDFKWFDTNTIDNLVKVSQYVQKHKMK